jgi:6-phosphogluconolactonase
MKDLRECLMIEPNATAVAERACDALVQACKQAITERGKFSLALTGGSSPLELYTRLAQSPHREAIDWSRVWLFFGDERAVPKDHAQSNYRAANETLISKVPVPGTRVFRMMGERDDLENAAREYEASIRKELTLSDEEAIVFDVLLLGIGGDAHILSLYPGCPEISRPTAGVVALRDPPMNPRVSRLTLTPGSVRHAREVMVLAHGAGKATALRALLDDPHEPEKIPAHLIREAQGRVSILCDHAARGV